MSAGSPGAGNCRSEGSFIPGDALSCAHAPLGDGQKFWSQRDPKEPKGTQRDPKEPKGQD